MLIRPIMRRTLVFCSIAAIAASVGLSVSASGAEPSAAADEKGWINLFDGKTLEGWIPTGNKKAWTVEDGLLVGRGTTAHLFTKTEYTDFEFKAQVKTEKRANSGMYFRAQLGGNWPKGYESQVNNTHPDPQKTGSLYGISKVLKQHARDYEFWTQHIICRGNHIIIKVNDKVVVDHIDKKNSFKKGHLAIQQHDPGSVVYYKDLKVKPL
jgi:hypothetical protein